MVRSVGITAVVVGLAWTGLAGAQTSSPPGTAAPKPRYIIVNEEGQQPQRCKVIRTWKEANGVAAFQVQAVNTGEIMTIVGSGPPRVPGDPKAMSTRIFHWGPENKPPAGVPMPPPTATTMTAPPAQPTPTRVEPIRTAPQLSAPPQLAATPKPAPVPQTVRKPDFTPGYTLTQSPTTLPDIKSSNPTPAAVVSQPKPVVPSKPLSMTPATVVSQPKPVVPSKPSSLTPMSTQVVQYPPAPTPDGRVSTPSAAPQPRLVPMVGGTTVSQKSSCNCSSSCNTCCQPCAPCSQSSCVSCTPSPLRQTFMSRLFKPNPPCTCNCTCTDVVSKPAPSPAPAKPTTLPTVVKATTEPAKPGDWRESWGKVEAWKTTPPATTSKPAAVLTKRADPVPVRIDPPKQPDPLKAPDQYRNLAMQARPSNSKIPVEGQPAATSRPMARIFNAKRPAVQPAQPPQPELLDHPIPDTVVQETVIMHTPPSQMQPNTQPPGRVIQLAADEPNAFWSPAQPPKPEAGQPPVAKVNAFDRDPNAPPQGLPQGLPPGMGQVARLPVPPSAPMPMMPPRPPMPPSMPDMGVPDALGNAFTLPGTRRPIPADFGGTPQEPNGFDPLVRGGQGTPPQAYGMSMPGMARPPMPNMMVAMGPQGPMAVNPLMSVPPTYHDPRMAAPMTASAPQTGVPQLLATLKNSLYPSEREAAIEKLSELNWRVQPLVVESLMKSAREDPAATVRAASVHALVTMKVDSPEAMTLVRSLKADRDPRVRQEAEEALNTLGDTGIQQASHK
ncbi:MAG TPA: HEAT repeat domain-containing protein [Gemmataceae bacterium]|nr:HEAT repeat domain-containing protein [Gemmataceae bacterium]